ncbi:MAG: phosphoglycerate kinase, partial [Candidatus Omnitrophica bacterium]|nr:phosphoglycerate kinase [Candidatus Omnitrophota bacterium]
MGRKISSILISLCLLFQQLGFASIATEINLTGHLSKAPGALTPDRFRPIHIRFFSYDALNDNIDVMLDKGDVKNLNPTQINESTQKLLNYFLVGVNLPNDKFWVNLRPDSEDSIIDNWLAKTDVGKIMLEADLQLKKDTAKFTSPETAEGRQYWNKLYKKAAELYGFQEISIPTLTRPWIVPNEIIVRESKDNAYIYKATLKVMLEQDILKDSSVYNFNDARAKALNEYSSQLIRELIIPKLTKEVNLSKRYASLRQAYYSIILSRWFKSKYTNQTGKYASRIDRKDLNGLVSTTAWSKATYFEAYKKSFAQGEYNIKETVNTPTGQVIRSYFSGGMDFASMKINGTNISSPITNSLMKAGLVSPKGITASISSPINAGPYDAEVKLATFDDFGKTINIRNKIVLYSPDMNAPAKDGEITDATHGRITQTGKNLKELLDNGAKVVVVFHQGRPGDPAFIENPDQHATILNNIAGGNRVSAINDLFGKKAVAAIQNLQPGHAIVLKQVRAKDPVTGKTLEESPWFVPTLRPLIDYLVLGGLSALGGSSNRITGFNGVPTIADRLMVSEIQSARNDRNPLKPHLAILGGSKVQKANAIISGLNTGLTDMVLVGGVPAEAVLSLAADVLALASAAAAQTQS